MISQAQLVKELRGLAGSRLKLANIAGVALSTAQNWEKKGSAPEGRTIARLLQAFPDRSNDILTVLARDPRAKASTPPAEAPPAEGSRDRPLGDRLDEAVEAEAEGATRAGEDLAPGLGDAAPESPPQTGDEPEENPPDEQQRPA